MNTKQMESLFTSKTRVALLKLFFLNKDREFYIREIEKETGISIGPIQHEIKNLVDIGIVNTRKSGQRIYYSVNKSHIIYEEMLSIIKKSMGIVHKLREILQREDIYCAFIYGSYATGKDTEESDIDLMIIGDITSKQVSKLLSRIESPTAINYNLMTEDEFREKQEDKKSFINRIINSKKIFIKGNDETIEEIIG